MSIPAPLTFGPSGREWHYTHSSSNSSSSGGTFDLRSSSSSDPATKPFTFSTTVPSGVAVPRTLGEGQVDVAIDPSKTAFVIIDMQNFFLDEKCRQHPMGLAAVEPTIRCIQKCREVGVQVIWLNWGLTSSDLLSLPASVQRGFMKHHGNDNSSLSGSGLGVDLGRDQGRTLCAGSWNAAIYPALQAQVDSSNDIQCAKNRMSGLWSAEQPLHQTLVERKITTLLFAGVNTDQCVLGTLVDAYNGGWDCVMVADACGTTTAGAREVTFVNAAVSLCFSSPFSILLLFLFILAFWVLVRCECECEFRSSWIPFLPSTDDGDDDEASWLIGNIIHRLTTASSRTVSTSARDGWNDGGNLLSRVCTIPASMCCCSIQNILMPPCAFLPSACICAALPSMSFRGLILFHVR